MSTSTSNYTEFLNRMLEAERAGARALVVFMDDWPRHGPEWDALRRVHDDEAHNCALLGELLKKAGADYSHATGEFFYKAVAVQDPRERIAFLVKGLEWAIRRLDEALPGLADADAKRVIAEMCERHRRSVAACRSLAA